MTAETDREGDQRDAGEAEIAEQHWGANSDVSDLNVVVMSPPTTEGLMVDPMSPGQESDLTSDASDEGWYWLPGECPPRSELPIIEMREQWDGLKEVLEGEGVTVVLGDGVSPGRFAHYTRDPLIAVPGGAVVGQMPPATRRGEEDWVKRILAELGMPILGTVTGDGQLECGSVSWLNPQTLVVARSNCVNEEGARQLEEVVSASGVEVLRTDLGYYDIHLDGFFGMIDTDLALVDLPKLPFSFVSKVNELGIETLALEPDDDPWVINSLAIRPGKVVMPEGLSTRTRQRIEGHGTEILSIPFDQIHMNGGGIRCSTCPLVRATDNS